MKCRKKHTVFFNWWQKIFACADLRCEKLYCNWKRWKLSWKSDWVCLKTQIWGNTAQRLCDRCVVKFFVRWNKKRSEYLLYSRAFLWNMRVCFVSDVCRLRRQIFWEMKGKTEKILCGFSSIFPKYLGKYARKMRARRYETGSEGKFASRWRAKSPDALCAVLP